MTLSTPPQAGTAARTTAAPDRTDAPLRLQPMTTGWYDPDGAAWEAESPARFESLRATVTRPAIVVDGSDLGDN